MSSEFMDLIDIFTVFFKNSKFPVFCAFYFIIININKSIFIKIRLFKIFIKKTLPYFFYIQYHFNKSSLKNVCIFFYL